MSHTPMEIFAHFSESEPWPFTKTSVNINYDLANDLEELNILNVKNRDFRMEGCTSNIIFYSFLHKSPKRIKDFVEDFYVDFF